MTAETSVVKRNTMATVSLVLGLVGFLGVGILRGVAGVVGIAAVVVGFIALKQIKENGEKGRGLAIAGLVLGFLVIIGLLVMTVMLLLGPGIASTFGDINSSLGQ